MQSIEVTKHNLFDQIEYTREQLMSNSKQEFEGFQLKIEDFRDQLQNLMKDTNSRTKSKILKIKDVCTNFFKTYEEQLNHMKSQFVEVHDAFLSWNRNVVRPNEIKEATLYALEARMNQEELARINDSILVKDVISKMIFSVHSNISQKAQFENEKRKASLQKKRNSKRPDNLSEMLINPLPNDSSRLKVYQKSKADLNKTANLNTSTLLPSNQIYVKSSDDFNLDFE